MERHHATVEIWHGWVHNGVHNKLTHIATEQHGAWGWAVIAVRDHVRYTAEVFGFNAPVAANLPEKKCVDCARGNRIERLRIAHGQFGLEPA